MNLALIVAAGIGKRMGVGGGKQFLPLLEKPMLAHTLISFQRALSIDSIVVITAEDSLSRCLSIIEEHKIVKVDRVVVGGAERQDSVYSGLRAALDFKAVEITVVHDGARPLIERELIDSVVGRVMECKDCDGAIAGIPAKDTIKLVREGHVLKTLDRSDTWQIQTPQAFRLDVLMKAHENARNEGFYGTDDSVLVERIGGKIEVVLGSEQNIKITTPSDLVLAEVLLGERQKQG